MTADYDVSVLPLVTGRRNEACRQLTLRTDANVDELHWQVVLLAAHAVDIDQLHIVATAQPA
jgi:hypothetical protein